MHHLRSHSVFQGWNKRIVLLATIEKKYLYPRCAKSLIPALRSGWSIWACCQQGNFLNKALGFTRLFSCIFSLFSSIFNMCQMSLPDWFLCVCERWSTWGTAQQRMHLYWWAAAPGAPWHQAVFPMDNHRKHHPSPICSCQRGFTKIGRAHPCLDLLHWPMPHHNLFIYRIFHVWPSSSYSSHVSLLISTFYICRCTP